MESVPASSAAVFAWLLLAPASFQESPQPAAAAPAPPPALLLFHAETTTGAERQVVEETIQALGGAGRIAAHPDSDLAMLAGPGTGREPRMLAYHATRRAGARGAWTVQFFRAQGVVQWEGFDDGQGVRARGGAKVRSLAQGRLSEEHLLRLRQEIAIVREELTDKSARCAAESAKAYVETIAWQEHDDPPHPGFRWTFDEAGPRVTYVFETSSIQSAGLQTGDLLLEIAGQAVATPPLLGRSLGPQRAGDALELTVLRAGRKLELSGTVEASAELVPRWQRILVGRPVPELGALIGDSDLPPVGVEGRPLLIVNFNPAQPDTWECVAVLRWLRDRYPEEKLAIVGVAAGTGEPALRRFLQETKPGWPAVADPTGQIGDALRVPRLPAFLLADSQGTLRFLQPDEAHLRQAIDSLPEPKE